LLVSRDADDGALIDFGAKGFDVLKLR